MKNKKAVFLSLVLAFSFALVSCTGGETRESRSEEQTSHTEEVSETGSMSQEAVDFVEYEGDMSKILGYYVRYDAETDEYYDDRDYHDFYDSKYLIEENHTVTLFRNGLRDDNQESYEWKAASSNEIALFQNGQDSGIRLIGVQGENQNGFGRIQKVLLDDSVTEEYVRRICDERMSGVYLPCDYSQEPDDAPYHLYIRNGGGYAANDEEYLYQSQNASSPFQTLSDIMLYCYRAFDDDEDYYEIRNNYGYLIYSLRRTGGSYELYKGDLLIGKYQRLSWDLLGKSVIGSYEPMNNDQCELPAFTINGEKQISIEDLTFSLSSEWVEATGKKTVTETMTFFVMGDEENTCIVLYTLDLSYYNMVFYSLKQGAEENVWTLFAHHKDGSVTEAGKYRFTAE